MKLFHVDASPKGATSCSRALSRHFVERLRDGLHTLSIDHLDLAIDPPPHVTEAFISAAYTRCDLRTPEMRSALAASDALCARVLAADALLFAMPMHNWTMPSSFKAFVDAIVRTDLTYAVTADGRYVGRLGGKRVLFLTTRGEDLRRSPELAAMDALTPALRAAFGFVGVRDPLFVDAQPVQFASPEARAAAMQRARAELSAVAEDWAGIRRAVAA